MIEAKYAEIRDIVNRGIFRAVLRAELPYGANLITERYMLSIKSDEDKEDRCKAEYVSDGHLDIMKDYLVHGSLTFQCVLIRRIPIVVKVKHFRIWIVDIKHAYFLSDKPLIRKVFNTKHAPEFELSPEVYLEHIKPIKGLIDSGDE